MTQTTETPTAYAAGVAAGSPAFRAGRDRCASLPEPERNHWYWTWYRHAAERGNEFAAGYCEAFRAIGRAGR